MENKTGNFYMFGEVILQNPCYIFGPCPMTTTIFDGVVPCFATRDNDNSVVGVFEHCNDNFMYEVPVGTYHISVKECPKLFVLLLFNDVHEIGWSIHVT